MTDFKKLVSKIIYVIILMTVIFEDFDPDNILKDKKSHKHVLVYNI